MKLPSFPRGDGLHKVVQMKFGGLNMNPGASEGEIADMTNLTGLYAPIIATRPKRWYYRTLQEPGGLFAWGRLCWVDGDGFFYDGLRVGTVQPGVKQFAAIGSYIIILPDKACYDTRTSTFGSLEASWSGASLTFSNGTLYGEQADANTLQAPGVNWDDYFKAGDAVEIKGCTTHPENNKTPIIREISGDKLIFYENVFQLNGADGTEAYTENGALSVARTMPDLSFVCENENRLWGCQGDTIYASKLGDPFNWNVFDGLSTDSYAVDTGSAGDFTACISYLGYPVFFKEDHIFKIYGSQPSNFEVMGSATLGVMAGSHESLAIAGETLFYLSPAGVMAYSGGIPQPIGEAFSTSKFWKAVGGSDGLNYYVCLYNQNSRVKLCVYGTRTKMWHVEDDTRVLSFASLGGCLYFLNDKGEIWIPGTSATIPEGAAQEEDFEWSFQFADFAGESPEKKGFLKLQVRIELTHGATAYAHLAFDPEHHTMTVHIIDDPMDQDSKRSYVLPFVPRRSDHYRLGFFGKGECKIYSITQHIYTGSELRSVPGRH